jgi:hypothetical protein
LQIPQKREPSLSRGVFHAQRSTDSSKEENNSHGEPVFDLHPTKLELHEDVKSPGTHKGLTPADLQARRPNYRYFDKTKFKECIYQEEKLQKYYHYLDSKHKAEQQYGFGLGDGAVFGDEEDQLTDGEDESSS